MILSIMILNIAILDIIKFTKIILSILCFANQIVCKGLVLKYRHLLYLTITFSVIKNNINSLGRDCLNDSVTVILMIDYSIDSKH